MKILDQLLNLCMSIYDVVPSDCKVYMMSFGVDESIDYLSMITCSFILKSGMKHQRLGQRRLAQDARIKRVPFFAYLLDWHCCIGVVKQHLYLSSTSRIYWL